MTTRSQKRKAIVELVSGYFEACVAENSEPEFLVPCPSKFPKIELEKIDEIKTSLTKKILSDLTKILADNQKEKRKLMTPAVKKSKNRQNLEDSDSETENALPTPSSTPLNLKRLPLKILRKLVVTW